MKILRALLLASAVGMSSAMPAAAQQAAAPSAEAIEEAKRLIAIVSPDMIKDMNSKMLAQLWPAMEQALQPVSSTLDAAATAELNAEVRAEFEKLMTAQLTEFTEVMPAVYAHYLTADEMREIIAFYRTPTGAKTLKVMPEIMGETMGKFAPHFQDTMQRLQVSLEGILQKHGLGPK
jgi:uncharacterized protein